MNITINIAILEIKLFNILIKDNNKKLYCNLR